MDDLIDSSEFAENFHFDQDLDKNEKTTADLEDLKDLTEQMEFWVNGVALTVTSISGIISNLICITILLCCRRRLNFRPAFSNLLALLSFFYIFVLAEDLAMYCAPALSTPRSIFKTYLFPVISVNVYPLLQIALSGVSLTLVSIALECYLNICTTSKSFWHHMWRGWGWVILVIVLSVLFNLNAFFEFTYIRSDDLLYVAPTALKIDQIYNNVSIALNIIEVFVALVVLSALSYKTFSKIKEDGARNHPEEKTCSYRDGAMVDILVGLVVVFIICNTPKVVLSTYEMISSHIYNDSIMYEGWTVVAFRLGYLLMSFSHAFNIVIFCCQDKMFRASLFCQRVEVSTGLVLT